MKKFWILSGLLLLTLTGSRAVPLLLKTDVLKASSSVPQPADQLKLNESYGQLPLYFEPNQGQTDSQVKFLSKGSGYTLFLTSKETVLVLNQPSKNSSVKMKLFLPSKPKARPIQTKTATVLRMKLAGANSHSAMEGLEKLPGISNYFIGNDPTKWRTNVPQYKKVVLKDVYPGIDMVYYGNQRHLEYDFVVAPGVDPKVIQLAWKGPKDAKVDSKGDLVLKAKDGQIVFKAPVVYQVKDGERRAVQGRYAMAGSHQVGFEVQNYDSSQPLVIDPQLDYSTYLGGSGSDGSYGIAVDSSGNAYVTGYADGSFPTTGGAYQTAFGGSSDAFVAKLNSTGSGLVYSTYLGGSSGDEGVGLVVDSSGNAYVTGSTTGSFPTTSGAYQTVYGGGTWDGFVTKLNATGNGLAYSTYLGGSGNVYGQGIAVDSSGNAYVTGYTDGSFPTTGGAYQTVYGGGAQNAFVAKLNATGSGLVYSTYLGGNGEDQGLGIAVDSSGNAYVTGDTTGSFPTTTGAYQTNFAGDRDVFVTKLNSTGTGLVYSTYLGGSSTDIGGGVAVDSSGNAYVTGYTQSSDFPTTAGAYQTVFGGNSDDAFVAKLNATGTGLVYSTYLGGSVDDVGKGISLDSSGNAYVTGYTNGNFPATSGAYQTAYGGSGDSFVTKFDVTAFYTPTPCGLPGNTCTPTQTGTPSYTPTKTYTYTPTYTYTLTLTPMVTPTPTNTLPPGTNTYTPGVTNTFTPTYTYTPSYTSTQTYTFTITFTNTITSTPVVTATYTPGYLGPNPPTPGTSFVYPSPATGGTVNIAYDMQESGTAQVSVWNASAELVTDVNQTQWVGPQKTTLNTQGWARGVYFYRVILHYNSGKLEKLPPDKFYVE